MTCGLDNHFINMWMIAPCGKYVLHQQLTARFSRLQLQAAIEWSDDNLMCVNCDKTKELLVFFGRTPPDIPSITIKGKAIERVTSTKLLGVIISDDLAWGPHITMIHGKASQRLYFLCLLKRAGVASIHIVRIYVSLVRSLLEYAFQVLHTGLTVSDSDRLEGIQKRARSHSQSCHANAPSPVPTSTPYTPDVKTCLAVFFRGMLSPTHKLHHLLPPPRLVSHNFRKKTQFPAPRTRTTRYQRTLIPYGLAHWQ